MDISTKEEILSRPLVDVTHLDIQSVNAAASMSTEFNTKLSVRRKSQDALNVNCHFVAVTCIGRKPTHFLITFGVAANSSLAIEHASNCDVANPIQLPVQIVQQSQQPIATPKPNTEPRGSLHGSIRRGSYTSLGFDARSIASENIRRTSLAKLSALPLEAPITKVTHYLAIHSLDWNAI